MIDMKTTHEFVAAAAIATIDNAAEKCCSLAEGGRTCNNICALTVG